MDFLWFVFVKSKIVDIELGLYKKYCYNVGGVRLCCFFKREGCYKGSVGKIWFIVIKIVLN